MTLTKLKAAVVALVVVGALASGASLVTRQALAAIPPAEPPAAGPKDAPGPQAAEVRAEVGPPAPLPPDPAHYARRLWATADVVLQQHLNPPARSEMLRAGAKALFQAAGADPPADLRRRIAEVETQSQLQVLLGEALRKPDDKPWPPAEQLQAAMLAGLLGSVPGNPSLLPAEYLRVADQLAGNRYIGIGIQIRTHDTEKIPQIVNPFRGGPAQKAGARPNDLIVAVNGRSTQGVGLQQVVEWLRGPQGSDVTVAVRQPGAAEARTLQVTRTVVPIDTVLGYRRKPDGDWVYRIDPAVPVGYLRITTTNASTLHELRQAEKRLRAEGVRALVLDLRSSQRHELHHIELVADGLLDGGRMWRLRGVGDRVQEFRADRDCLFRGWPLAVIVESRDGETPPGEIVAALQDNARVVVVGATLQCEGHVKSLVHLPDGQGAVALLTGRLERADGRTWPVRPDHPVALEPAQRMAVLGWLHAKELSELPPGASDRLPDDPQLRKAVEVLREALKNAE